MGTPLFTKQDFDNLRTYGGSPYLSAQHKDKYDIFSELYSRFSSIRDKMTDFEFVTKGWQNSGTIQKSIWARVYPKDYFNYCEDIALINFSLVSDGILLKLDTERKKNNEPPKAAEISDKSEVRIPESEVLKCSKEDLARIITNYYTNHREDYLRYGAEFGIQQCIDALNCVTGYKPFLEKNHNIILTGAPGTGKTYLAHTIAAEMIGCTRDELKTKYNDQFGFVQFHPSYDYTDFVEGLRPKQNGNNIVFERKDGVFMEFCRKALEDCNKAEKKEDAPKYVFVIDEINRGEISKIFGELFFSIDPDYRGEKGGVSTQYSNLWTDKDYFDGGKKFYVPENVYVIGTMNDIDRSVESMDYAFRRRFAFIEIKAKDRLGMLDGMQEKDEAIKRMEAVNNVIRNAKKDGLGEAYELGASYFKKIEKYGNWDDLWKYHIEGVIKEYLRGKPDGEELYKRLIAAFDNKVIDDNPDGNPT